jgi:hypothetical protein
MHHTLTPPVREFAELSPSLRGQGEEDCNFTSPILHFNRLILDFTGFSFRTPELHFIFAS